MKRTSANDPDRVKAAARDRLTTLRARYQERAPREREAYAARLARHKQDLAERRAASKRTPQADRRRWLVVAVLVLLVLLLGRSCSCATELPAPMEPTPVDGSAVGGHGGALDAPPHPRPKGVGRPAFVAPAAVAVTWTTLLHQQVAARGPALAACVEGADTPSAVRWSFALEPREGRVSAASLEPLLGEVALTSSQEACVLGVLAEPPYRLGDVDQSAIPRRVTLVVEL